MKRFVFALLLLPGFSSLLPAQTTCKTTPVFSPLANHTIQYCDEKEFDQLRLQQKDAARDYTELQKQGHKLWPLTILPRVKQKTEGWK